LGDLILKDVIHHGLKGGRGVGEAKEHNSRFKESLARLEGGFPFVTFFDADVVIPPSYVKLGKESFSC
jgi:hypothetical protein